MGCLRRSDGSASFPTKPFILAAGVLQAGKLRFAASVFAGRLVRYSLLGYLGAKFGDQSAKIIKSHYPEIFIALLCGILLVVLIRSLRNKKSGVITAYPNHSIAHGLLIHAEVGNQRIDVLTCPSCHLRPCLGFPGDYRRLAL